MTAAGGRIIQVRKPRILHVGPPSYSGGIGTYLLGLLDSSLARQYEFRIVDVRVPGFFRRFRAARPLLTVNFMVHMAQELTLRRPALVHVHTSDYGGFWEKSLLAAMVRLWRRPYLLHLHGGTFDRFLTDLRGVRVRLASHTLREAALVVVPSESWRTLVARFVPEQRLEVLANAIRLEEFDAAVGSGGSRELRLLFLGMLSERKGLDELLAAVLEMQRRGCERFHLDVVGGEEFHGEAARYRRLFHAAGLDACVTFHGPVFGAAKLAFLRAADVFILPSRNESFGIANLEAMACGLAVVTTRTGAIPEYMTDEIHGLLIEPRDASALAEAILRLGRDPALRRRLGEAAKARARDFGWDSAAPRLGTLYEQVRVRSSNDPGCTAQSTGPGPGRRPADPRATIDHDRAILQRAGLAGTSPRCSKRQ